MSAVFDPLAPGAVVAGYVIERQLGSGGMGTVYAAAHPRLPRHDALKVLSLEHSSDSEFRARFIREAELAARLDHPNIVAVHDRGVDRDRLWIAMQLVDGIDAAELIRRGPAELPPARAAHIVAGAARGLDEAHRHGLLHRDVKPANLMVQVRPGQPERVYVTDFGIARAAAETTALTEIGTVLATLAYAAPEQLGGGAVDYRVDIYALGCTLYEMLTGAKPFPNRDAAEVIRAHIHDPPPRAATANPALPPAIDEVIARAMAKDPDQRYPSCGALAAAAASALGVSAAAGRHGVRLPEERGRSARRPRIGYLVAGGIVASVAILGVASALVSTRHAGEMATTPGTPPSSGTTGTSAAASPTVTSASAATSWGGHNYMVRVLPELLPETPAESGYQGMRCLAVDEKSRPVDVNQRVSGVTWISCNGNRDPMDKLLVECNANRRSATISAFNDGPPIGDEQWQRPSGSGRVMWEDDITRSGSPRGILQVQFHDAGRTFCNLVVFGGSSGQELFDRWWRDAPF
ncbi:serine/threonine-protein kinase [Nocardia aurea]|uniref:non-specific serine/threonine protein kinase n=2 Tax=Nocardia aurea TaxID=2144174 RepID=A0ABV3FY03_9NOCA